MTDSDKCPTEQPSIECETEIVPRRSERVRHPPDFYGIRVNVTSQNPKEPKSIEKAVIDPKNQSGKKPWKWKFGILLGYQKKKEL